MKQYVIIGNGIAAAGCIEGIRSKDGEGKITVVSGEKYPAYCRPLISYYLENKTDLQKIHYRPDDFYEKNGAEVLYGVTAVSADAEGKTVTLSDGSVLPYTELLIATGSKPFVPRFEGLDTVEQSSCFMTIDDALSVEKALTPEAKVLIIGAGFIGLKCAEGIHGRAKSITVCDLADHILPAILDNECAAMMQKRLEENGISFLMGDTAVRFDGHTAYLKSGGTLEFDILVLAVGVRPNVDLFKSAGGVFNRGIPVNIKMETALPGIYAAGDCTECLDITRGESMVLANLPSAYMQGRCAGVNMAGGEELFDKGILMNSIGFFGLHVISAGTRTPETEVCREKGENTMRILCAKDDKLVGYSLVGNVERAGIYTALIRNQVPLSSLDFETMKQLPALTAYTPEARKAMLGGVV